MRGQTIIRAAWVPLLAGALGVLYAPNTLVFYLASAVFVAAATLQVSTAVRIFQLSHRHVG